MNLPGEALLIKLWDTLADKGIGGLLRPWAIRREGFARIEVRQAEIVALAAAEQEADEIRSGKLKLSQSHYVISVASAADAGDQERVEPSLGTSNAIEMATAAVIADALGREVRVARAITHAEEEIKSDPQDPPNRNIDSDWLLRWRENAGSVSSDELQSLWGKILAGEVKSPGSISLRTLEFVKNLSLDEAKRIAALARFVINDFVVMDQNALMEMEGIDDRQLGEMEHLGLISLGSSLGFTYTLLSASDDSFLAALCSNGKVLLARHEDPQKNLTLQTYQLTSLGRQVLKLGRFEPHNEYLRAVGSALLNSGVSVRIADYRNVSEKTIQFFNERGL